MKKRIHWLSDGNNVELDLLFESNLASTRLRTAVACKFLKSKGYTATVGDFIVGKVDKVIIGKIGLNSNKFENWISQIIEHKKNDTKIYLDYTDNHMGIKSPVQKYYQSFFAITDSLIVTNNKMKEIVSDYWYGPIDIIPDAIEVDIVQPKDIKNTPLRLLWFGHVSNLEFLINYIENNKIINDDKYHIKIMTNLYGIELINKYLKKYNKLNNVDIFEWSKNLMCSVALNSDVCIIPSSKNNPRKSGVSSNRLITALALGLPTLATSLPSYQDYSKYYIDIDLHPIDSIQENLKIQKNIIKESQNFIFEKYSKYKIGELWQKLIDE